MMSGSYSTKGDGGAGVAVRSDRRQKESTLRPTWIAILAIALTLAFGATLHTVSGLSWDWRCTPDTEVRAPGDPPPCP